MLVVFRGLPGTGKSYLVRKLVDARPDFLILSRDALRSSILPRPTFSEPEKGLIDDLIVEASGFLLRRGRRVVIDGMALSSAQRVGSFVRAASAAGSPWRIIECECSEQTALVRLTTDAGAHPAGDRGHALYAAVRQRFASVDYPVLRVDTDDDTAANLGRILAYLETGG